MPSQLDRLKKGVYTEIGRLKALSADFCRGKTQNWVKVIIAEGKNRQLHRMFEKTGLKIKVLRRVAIGRFKIKKSLKSGQCVLLSQKDRQKILARPKEL